MFHYKKHLLLSILALFCISMVSAQTIIDQWTFTDATTPQNSDINGKAMDTWDPALAGNSWANGVLTWGYVNTAEFKTATTAWMGNPNLGVSGGTLSQLVLVIDAKDINFSQNGSYGWQFTGTTSGNVRARIYSFDDNVTMKITGTGTEASSTALYSQADYSSITDLQLTFTWDLANNTMSLAANGSGVLAAGGTGTITLTTESFAQDLSGVTNLTGFRTYVQGQGTSYMELDTVTIATNTGNTDNTPPEAPVISNATETTVTGTAEANSTITVYGEDGTTVLDTGTTDGSGNYTVNFTTVQLPCTTIKVSAKDASNNESQKTDGTISTSETPILRTALLYSCFPPRLQTYVDTNPDKAQKGIIDVTLPPYNAAGNGVADDTQAIQNAIDDAYLYNFAVHLPANKIFLVTQQLSLITTIESRRYGHQFIGDANGAKPIIRLVDGSGLGGKNNYDDALVRFQYNNGQGGTEVSKHYTATFRNIDIDMGNNPAATALTMAGAQHCVIEDVKIYGEAFNVGIQDLPGSGGSTVNVHIIGGNIGIYQDQNRTVPTLIGLVLEEQIERGIKLTNTQGPLVIAGFKISSTQAPSTDYRAIFLNNQNSNQTDVNGVTVVDHANSNLSLTDGSIEVAGANGVAIKNGRQDLSLVNVYIKANTLIENGVFTPPTSYVQGDENQWKKISKHYYTSVLDISSVVIDGQSLNNRTDSYEFTGTITDESPDTSIYTKHSYGEVPDFKNPNIVDITTYGATTANIDPDDDDGVAIQLAIDDVTNPTSANFGKTVLIPRGNFGIDTPLVVKKGTKLIGTAKNISTIYANNPWANDNGAIITTVDDANGDIILSDFSILGYPRMCYLRVQSGNTVVRDIMTEDKIRNGWPDTNWETVNTREGTYIDFSNNAGGKVYHVSTDLVVVYDRFYVAGVSNYHLVSVNNTSNPLTIYQISVEHHVFSPKMLVKNAKNLTIFGFKYEGPAELLHIVNSDNIEICGGAGNYFMDNEGETIIKIINSTNILLRTMSRKTKHGEYIFGRDYPVNDITQFWLTDSGTEVSPYHAVLWYQVGNPTTLYVEETNNVSSQLKVYPNPVDDYIHITSLNHPSNYRYRFINISGMVVQEGFLDGNMIHCSSLPSGVYVLNIYSESDHYNIKVIKN